MPDAECSTINGMEILEFEIPRSDVRSEVVDTLSLSPKKLPCKLLYDAKGSKLFDQICELPEYYPTRTEAKILRRHAPDMARAIGDGNRLVEFGSGSSIKTRILLDAVENLGCYLPVDISKSHLIDAATAITEDYPDLKVVPIVADYTQPFHLPEAENDQETTGFFPGSTIGNFERSEAVAFLRRVSALLGRHGGLIIGFDLQKDTDVIERAYNDQQQVTAAFNLNLLDVLNRTLGTDFTREGFEHRAVYCKDTGRIEMRLISRRKQEVKLADKVFHFDEGEYIVTEYSHKFKKETFTQLAAEAGFAIENIWTDSDNLFAIAFMRVAEPARAG